MAIYTSIIEKIKETAEGIPEIAEVFMHPLGAEVIDFETMERTGTRVKNYPALIFSPAPFTNQMSSVGDNERTMRFNCWLIINAENIEEVDLYERILPNAVDGVLEAFDQDWNFGTINGHRVRGLMTSGSFGITPGQAGREVWCEMVFEVRTEIVV